MKSISDISPEGGIEKIATALEACRKALADDLDASLNDVPDKGRTVGCIHPSQVWGCLRKNLYILNGELPDSGSEARMRQLLDTGTAVHRQYQDYYANLYKDRFEAEVPIGDTPLAKRWNIVGHADGVIKLDDVHFLLEIKTIRTDGFRALKAPEEKHIQQAMIYAACLDLPIVSFLYYNKNDSYKKVYPVTFRPDAWSEAQTRIATIHAAKRSGELPPKTRDAGECRLCGYRKRCKGEGC